MVIVRCVQEEDVRVVTALVCSRFFEVRLVLEDVVVSIVGIHVTLVQIKEVILSLLHTSEILC